MRIAEISEKYGITQDTLRYYERIGLLPPIARTASGVRNYSDSDCARIEFIKCMRQAHVSIEALQTYMRLLNQGEETLSERKAILTQQRDLAQQRITEMQKALDLLTYKIDHYEDLMRNAEESLG